MRTVEKWFSGEARPSLDWFGPILCAYGLGFVIGGMSDPAPWLDDLAREERTQRLLVERQAIDAQLAADWNGRTGGRSMIVSASTCPTVDAGSPEWRAALFGQAIAYAAHLTGPICPYSLGSHLYAFLGQAEEECGGEALDAIVMLIRTGLFSINTIDDETGDVTFEGETKLTVAPMLTAYLYGEDCSVA